MNEIDKEMGRRNSWQGKALTYFAKAKSAGIIMGAKAPIVLVSRADSHESKLYSIAYGALVAKYNK